VHCGTIINIRFRVRKRKGEILFIDAGKVCHLINRTHRVFTDEDIARIAGTYHEWRKEGGKYEDIKGFCKSATLEDVEKHKFVLTPGRYVGVPDGVDDGVSFDEKMKALTGELRGKLYEES
jgi:type I restriction enzyme M protein